MIVGVGIDVVDVARFTAVLERTPRVAERVFTVEELDQHRNAPASLAARFAAKEAVAKALTDSRLRFQDAWVRRLDTGQPVLEVRGTVAARAEVLGVSRFHLSLSHDAGIASAVVIAERD
ncbi:MAG: holo-ACP synthase [Actinomycetales bacterium]